MKKKLICLLLTVCLALPFVLTGCGDDEDIVDTGIAAKTVTLYGITGESTTEEAILAVEEALNEYTEGHFNTHVVLKFYPEATYYQVVEDTLAAAKQAKIEEEEAKAAAKKKNKKTAETTGAVTEAETVETYEEHGVTKTVYPEAKEHQIDIFMVQGAGRMTRYKESEYLSSLSESLNNESKKLYQYIAKDMWTAVTLDGTATAVDTVEKGDVYGIPNNNVFGEYTYLLLNKELADKYYYSVEDVSTLKTLSDFLDDVAENDKDYIPLYNLPTDCVELIDPSVSLVGGVYSNLSAIYTRMQAMSLAETVKYKNHLTYTRNFRNNGWLTEGDAHAIPEGTKVGAAFLTGNAALPDAYEDEYYIYTYAQPYATRNDRPGTMFCVSSYVASVERCMEIITDLNTVPELRNLFQYGIEDVNYQIDLDTGYVNYLNDTYMMDPADTGNLFIMTPNSDMSPEMLALAADEWKLGKQQYRDTVCSPWTMFDLRIVTAENYKTTSPAYLAAFEEAYAAAKKADKNLKESEFTFDYTYQYPYTDELLAQLAEACKEWEKQIAEFEEYVDEDGKTITFDKFLKNLANDIKKNEAYASLFEDTENPDSIKSQYTKWFTDHGPSL